MDTTNPENYNQECNKTHTIIIARRGNWVVRPGRLNVRVGDEVTFMAIGTPARILFPNERLFGRRAIDIGEPQGGRSESVRVGEVSPNVYPYAIFCDVPNAFAQGGSDPELIVER